MEMRDREDMQALFDRMGTYSAGFFNKQHANENRTMAFFRDGEFLYLKRFEQDTVG